MLQKQRLSHSTSENIMPWNVDHQPYHILMEDAIANYMKLKYVNSDDNSAVDDGYGTPIKEMDPTDQIIMVQEKGNTDEIHEIWYGNGLDFIVIDREKVDWIFSQDIQRVLIAKDEYLTSDSEMVFHESERDRLMAGYGTNFSVGMSTISECLYLHYHSVQIYCNTPQI